MFKHHDALKDAKLKPLWHDPEIMSDLQSPLAKDERCELLVVGGGFTGLWAAVQAKERKPEVDIILIEQTFVGDGASGRNGGFLSTSISHGETNTDTQFPSEADQLVALGIQNITELLETLKRYHIDAHYEEVIGRCGIQDVGGALGTSAQTHAALRSDDLEPSRFPPPEFLRALARVSEPEW